jgi:hypothetical protein
LINVKKNISEPEVVSPALFQMSSIKIYGKPNAVISYVSA